MKAKGILHWFKSNTKIKRWIVLILIGFVLCCFAMAKILVLKEMSFSEVTKIIIIFVVGFLVTTLGLILLNKRTLEIFIESTDDRMLNKKNINVNSLIFNKQIYEKGPNVVVIGSGAGMYSILEGLKEYTNNITALVTVSTYGRQKNMSKEELGVLAIDDIKNSMIALSNNENILKNLFNFKFSTGRLIGLNFDDIYFTALNAESNNFSEAIDKGSKILNIKGKVLPITTEDIKICAELENGYIVEEKDRIPEMVYDRLSKISRVFITPSNCRPAPGVIDAITNADCIIIGPGSLYTNVIPNLLVPGVSKAIKESKAFKVYVCNIMTDPGQTDGYSVSDHIKTIQDYCGDGMIDYCIYDTGEIIPEFVKMYNRQNSELVEQDIEKTRGIKFIKKNMSTIVNGAIRHDGKLVAEEVIKLVCDDLKFQDKQNDPEYVMMNTKLKEDKRINKLKKNQKKYKKDTKDKHSRMATRSKFSAKYNERIKSIKEADEKFNKNK